MPVSKQLFSEGAGVSNNAHLFFPLHEISLPLKSTPSLLL